MSSDGSAHAVEVGRDANDLPAFTISEPIDALPEGVSAHNLTITAGGSDIEEEERFRERAANGNFRISKAGPRNGYREFVKGLHPDIVDVGVIRPEPGHIDIYPLMKSGIPTAEISALVFTGLDPEKIVPMGDDIEVKDPTPVPFDFTLIIRINAADATIEDAGRAKAEAVFAAWSQLMGVRIAPSVITSEVRQLSGVIDAETEGLDYIDLADTEYAVLNDLTLDVRVTPNV